MGETPTMIILTKYKNFALKLRKIYTTCLFICVAVSSPLHAQYYTFRQNHQVFSVNSYTFPFHLGIKNLYSISQNNLGVLFFSTNKGIVHFDGTSWGIIPCSDSSFVASNKSGLYVFSKLSVGEIENTSPFNYTIKPVKAAFPSESWIPRQISSTGDSIFIVTNNQAWLYRNNKISLISGSYEIKNLVTDSRKVYLFTPSDTLQLGQENPEACLNPLPFDLFSKEDFHYLCQSSVFRIYTKRNELFLYDTIQKNRNLISIPSNDSILKIYTDVSNIIWVLTSKSLFSIKRVDYYTHLTDANAGAILSKGMANDSSVLFYAGTDKVFSIMPFKEIASLSRIQLLSNIGKEIVCLGNDGIYKWNQKSFEKVFSRPVDYAVKQQDAVFFISKNTLNSLRSVGNDLLVKEISRISRDSIRKVLVEPNGNILLLDNKNRIYQLVVSKAGVTLQTLYDPSKGIMNPSIVNMYRLGESLLLTDGLDFFSLEGNSLHKIDLLGLEGPLRGNIIDYFDTDGDSCIWYATKIPNFGKQVYFGRLGKSKAIDWFEIPLNEAGLFNPVIVGSSKEFMVFYENGSFYELNLASFLSGSNDIKIVLQELNINAQNQKTDLSQRTNTVFEAPYPSDLIYLKFRAIDLLNNKAIKYSYLLEGYEVGWSPWSLVSERYLSRLSPGTYKFLVRALSNGKISKPYEIKFHIPFPIYLRWYAWVFYIAVFISFIIGLGLNRKRLFEKERSQLEHIIQERTSELMREKEKTDELLANLLPKDTADELKSKGKASSQKFDLVTVLFSDIQGFTKIAEQMNPERLIDELDNFFFHFDSVVEKYNIEKIKTIGDAYMAAGGIPYKNRTNPVEVVLAALEVQDYMMRLKQKNSDIWDLRIGIHTGAVIAGVVGHKRVSYDIWGDTVNTASRMQSSGEPGKINISGQTYDLVKDFFICEYRGKMPVKYKGDVDMYFVKGIRPELSVNLKSIPNKKFFIQLQLLRLHDLEEFIMHKLERELPDNLFFHNLKHTKDVYTQAELLGRAENISPDEMLLLRSAALLHDIGFISAYHDHELKSVEFAREILPKFKYTPDQCEAITSLILCTRSRFNPRNKVEELLIDANLDYLGRVDYIAMSVNLYRELRMFNGARTEVEWFNDQIKLVEEHQFYSQTARRLREVKKEDQIVKIKEHLLKLYV